MREMTLEELKKTQIEILDVIHNFCVSNDIAYWIDCGTLLGAIRHKGYIPWDDDVDIGMLRPDYNKFLATFGKDGGKYDVLEIDKDPNYFWPFAKVVDKDTRLTEHGENFYVNVDVFVYDNAPDDDNLVEKMYNTRDKLMHLYLSRGRTDIDVSNPIKRMAVVIRNQIIKLHSSAYYIRRIVSNSKKYAQENTARVGNFMSYKRIAVDKNVFSSFIDVEFEGKKYKAPIGYDTWLQAFYKDYLQLPPVEKRNSTHVFKAYIND